MQGLSLEVIPPLHIPLRFFLTAPCMGILAALALLLADGGALQQALHPALLGITHLLTLGFMAMVMLGAMLQLVPVISGHLVPGGAAAATTVHLLLLAGVLLLAGGFVFNEYRLLPWAGLALVLAFASFLLPLASLLLRPLGGDAIFSIRLAALSLLLTVVLGLWRAAAWAGLAAPEPPTNITNLHLGWGLAGWTLLLVMGASYQVIPMFHVTPGYPRALARALPVAVFAALLALSVFTSPTAQAVALLLLCASASGYALLSLRLLGQRKRRIADITARFWALSLGSLATAAIAVLLLYGLGDQLASHWQARGQVALGILCIYGFAISVIMGMLQKMVPFLSYLHLQRRCLGNFEALKDLPHMGLIIPEHRSRRQYLLHCAALALLLLATAGICPAWMAGAAMLADFGFLAYTLLAAALLYRRSLPSH
ncbi:hypothetical protein DWB85_14250 [Seongchinamella sediminis]|uniref:Uncharacterized protein n=1 Tax=Seongchinamella sediminis TaxID=2283635 RepID=A0A3L7DVB0_9GAMM|nr:hypothetical protein [Seongchinamella sediminis]RLQ21056.1 hypothetical protein DWB85_14250 [Seongchinamella sediminis]